MLICLNDLFACLGLAQTRKLLTNFSKNSFYLLPEPLRLGEFLTNYCNYVLTQSDQYSFGEERRLFYVAITRAKVKTLVLYDKRFPSVFVDEFLHPENISEANNVIHRNANKRWTKNADLFLLKLDNEGKSVKYIANKMGRSQTSIIMRLNKLKNL